jgi:hypothetical protein
VVGTVPGRCDASLQPSSRPCAASSPSAPPFLVQAKICRRRLDGPKHRPGFGETRSVEGDVFSLRIFVWLYATKGRIQETERT